METIGNKSHQFLDHADTHPTALSLCTFNTQSLKTHCKDIITESVIPKSKIIALTETWVENDEHIEIPGYQPISQFKRNAVQAGGVCIYEKEECSSALQSSDHEIAPV